MNKLILVIIAWFLFSLTGFSNPNSTEISIAQNIVQIDGEKETNRGGALKMHSGKTMFLNSFFKKLFPKKHRPHVQRMKPGHKKRNGFTTYRQSKKIMAKREKRRN